MTLNFPDSPSTGDIYNDSTSGFQYEWNGTVWISTDPQRAANIKELDDISGSFNGSTTQFNLRVSSSAVEPVSDSQLLISVGGVMQNPTNDYTVVGSTITFTTAPSAGLTFFGTFLGQALSLNTVQDGTVEFASFKTGTAGVGIKSDGTAIGVGITQIDFVGSGNTVVSVGNTVSVYIAAGIDTTGTSKFNNIITTGDVTGNLNVTGIVTATTVHGTLATAAQTNITSVGTLSALTATSLTAATGVTTNATNTQLVVTGISTYTGAIDANGGANIAGGLVANSAQVSDLTSGRVTYAGGSGELQDSGNLTFSGSELTASSATVSDLTDNRVVIAGTSGALEDSSNLTFDGSTLTVNGDVSVAGTITYQEVAEIDAVGFVTARKGVRVTNGGIIVTAGISTFNDDIKFDGADYDITYDRSASAIIWDDNAKATFGSGNDLQLYHNGTHSYIDNNQGNLYIRDDDILLSSLDGTDVFFWGTKNGAVKLYHNAVNVFQTTSVGINVVGNVDCDSLNNAGITTLGGALNVNTGHVNVDVGYSYQWGDGHERIEQSDGNLEFFTANTEKMRLSGGMLLVGTAANQHSTGHILQAASTSSTGSLSLNRYSANAHPSYIEFFKSRNASLSGQTVVQDGDNLGQITWAGSDGTNRAYAAYIDAEVDGTPGDGDMPGRLTFSTSADGSESPSERMRIDSSGRILIGTTTEGNASADNLTIADSGACGMTIRSASNNVGNIFFSDSTSGVAEYAGYVQYDHSNNTLVLGTSNTTALTFDSSQNATFAGTVSDSKGNLRSIPIQSNSGSHTLTAASAGKVLYTDANTNVNNSVFSAGDAVTIINNSGSDVTITQGSGLTIYNTADASTGNRTLAGRGMSTIWFASASVAYISGAGLS